MLLKNRKKILELRKFEQDIVELFNNKKIRAPIHLSYGNEKALIEIFKDIKILNTKNNIILLSPAAASFDQFKNFENRGNEFKKLSKYYARKII